MSTQNIFESVKDFFEKNRDSNKVIAIALASVLALAFVLFSNYGVIKRVSLELNKTDLIESISQKELIKDSLKTRVEQLKTDDTEIERIARQKYGMVKPNEEVYFKKQEE